MNLDNHPTVIEIRRRNTNETTVREPGLLDADLLKKLCLERVSLDDISRQAQPNPLHPQHGAYHHG